MLGCSASHAGSSPHSLAKASLKKESRRSRPKMATASLIWLSVASCAVMWRRRELATVSPWVTSMVHTATSPLERGTARTSRARREPACCSQRTRSTERPALATDRTRASAPASSVALASSAASRSAAPTARNQAALAKRGLPLASAIQAGAG